MARPCVTVRGTAMPARCRVLLRTCKAHALSAQYLSRTTCQNVDIISSENCAHLVNSTSQIPVDDLVDATAKEIKRRQLSPTKQRNKVTCILPYFRYGKEC
eukprot:173304-Pleurochrysis_carterae.AAC.3